MTTTPNNESIEDNKILDPLSINLDFHQNQQVLFVQAQQNFLNETIQSTILSMTSDTNRLLKNIHDQIEKHETYIKEHTIPILKNPNVTEGGKLPYENGITTQLLSVLNSQAERHRTIMKKQEDFLKKTGFTNFSKKTSDAKTNNEEPEIYSTKEKEDSKVMPQDKTNGEPDIADDSSFFKQHIRKVSLQDEEILANIKKELAFKIPIRKYSFLSLPSTTSSSRQEIFINNTDLNPTQQVKNATKSKCLLKEGSPKKSGDCRKVSIGNVTKEQIIEQRGMDRLKKLINPSEGLSESSLSSPSSSKREVRKMSIVDEEMFKNAQKEMTVSEVTMQVINGLRRPTIESLKEAIHNIPQQQEIVNVDSMEHTRRISTESKNRDSFLKLVKNIEEQREEANKRRLITGTKNSQTQTSFESYEFYIDIDVIPGRK